MGGLGNQMFQYANAKSLALSLNCPLKFRTDSFKAYKDHNGFELERIFNLNIEVATDIELSKLIGWFRTNFITRHILSKEYLKFLNGDNFYSDPNLKYCSDLINKVRYGGYLHGYWQSEQYFDKNISNLLNDFTFRDELNFDNLNIARLISKKDSISVHIRRGDYFSKTNKTSIHNICSIDYYKVSINFLLRKFPSANLLVFSDDPLWVSQNLLPHYANMILVDHNKGPNSYNDMRLMSLCQHHIIANSSFSWWGAWLNRNIDKIVVAPKKWYSDDKTLPDLIPKSWIRM
jgi:hypothetical protein